MNCGRCTHWTFKDSPLKDAGFGLCAVEKNDLMRVARTSSAQLACRNGKFEMAAMATLKKREKALSR